MNEKIEKIHMYQLSEEERKMVEKVILLYRNRVEEKKSIIDPVAYTDTQLFLPLITNYFANAINLNGSFLSEEEKSYIINLYHGLIEIVYGTGFLSGMQLIDNNDNKEYPVWNELWDTPLNEV